MIQKLTPLAHVESMIANIDVLRAEIRANAWFGRMHHKARQTDGRVDEH